MYCNRSGGNEASTRRNEATRGSLASELIARSTEINLFKFELMLKNSVALSSKVVIDVSMDHICTQLSILSIIDDNLFIQTDWKIVLLIMFMFNLQGDFTHYAFFFYLKDTDIH